jgi:hypothetical protein
MNFSSCRVSLMVCFRNSNWLFKTAQSRKQFPLGWLDEDKAAIRFIDQEGRHFARPAVLSAHGIFGAGYFVDIDLDKFYARTLQHSA